jgi:replicative DNA helicase
VNGVLDEHGDPGAGDESLPPHDERAERATLGAMMMTPRAVADVLDLLTAEDYWSPRNAWVFDAIRDLSAAGVGVDMVTVQAELAKRGKPEAAVYVLDLYESTPTAANATYYAAIVAEMALRRRIAEVGQRAYQRAWALSEDGSAAELVENVRSEFDRVAGSTRQAAEVLAVEDLAAARLEAYGQDAEPGLRTGFVDLDRALGGLGPGTLTIIGARPGVGKSVLGSNIAMNAAFGGEGVGFFSLEMTREELTDRMLASLGSVELGAIRDRKLSEHDWNRLQAAANKIHGVPLKVVDIPDIGIAGIRTIARDLTRTPRGLGLLVVDYLQLMKPADKRAPRQEQVASLSRGLKLLAKELHVPVIALSQVNRGPEQRTDKRPTMADLRESGAIEADADVVLLLHVEAEKAYEIEVIVGKNRHGGKGAVSLSWSPHYARAGNLGRHLEAA